MNQHNKPGATLNIFQENKIWIVFLSVTTLWLLNWYFLKYNVTERGTIGDMFGVFNSIISGLGFVGIIWAIFLQRNQIELQQKEIDRANEEIRYQHNLSDIQSFENRFYELIRFHRDNLIEITISDVVNGRKAFVSMFKEYKFAYYSLKLICNSLKKDIPDFKISPEKDLINISYIVFFYGSRTNIKSANNKTFEEIQRRFNYKLSETFKTDKR